MKKVATTRERLQELMNTRNLRQVDILEKVKPYCDEFGVKIGKSHISQYLSGKAEPKQDKLYILAAALNVSEGWLIGLDAPMERMSDAERFARTAEIYNLTSPHLHTEQERRMMLYFRRLSDVGKERLEKLSQNLYEVEEMEKKLSERKGESDDNGKKETHPSS